MFQFQTVLSIADVINFGLLLAAVIGIFLSLRQTQENTKTQKASFFKDLYSTMFADRDIRDAYYKIEYDDFNYGADFHGSQNERVVDRLLSFVDLVCDLRAQGILSDHEMSFFHYELMRIHQNRNVQGYINFLEDFYPKTATDTKPFASFTKYCRDAEVKPR